MKYRSMIIILLILFIPNAVYASENIYTECNENECVLYGETDYMVSAIEVGFSIENNLDYTFIKDDSWEGLGENNLIALYTNEFKINKFKLGTLRFNEPVSNDVITYTSLKIYDENFQEIVVDVSNINNENIVNNEIKSVNIMSIIFILLIIFAILIIGIVRIRKRSSKNEKNKNNVI